MSHLLIWSCCILVFFFVCFWKVTQEIRKCLSDTCWIFISFKLNELDGVFMTLTEVERYSKYATYAALLNLTLLSLIFFVDFFAWNFCFVNFDFLNYFYRKFSFYFFLLNKKRKFSTIFLKIFSDLEILPFIFSFGQTIFFSWIYFFVRKLFSSDFQLLWKFSFLIFFLYFKRNVSRIGKINKILAKFCKKKKLHN